MFKEILKLVEQYDSIVIFGHIYPDGDCYGSQIALREILKAKYPNKQVFAVGSGFHRFHRVIGDMDVVEDRVIKQSLAIIVDSNDLPRIEDQRVGTAKAFAKIDHHVDTGFFTEGPQLVDERANSTCEIITRLAIEYKLPINETIANALFLGIMTDTGRFQFIYDYAAAFKEVAWLCENGANPKILNQVLNITYEPFLAFRGYVLSHYRKGKGVVYVILRYKTLKKYKLSADKAANMVNLISSIYGYPVWVFFCEDERGRNHVEIRSNGPVIQPVAAKYGGGGHLHASGVTLASMEDNAIDDIIKQLEKAVHDYREEKKHVGK